MEVSVDTRVLTPAQVWQGLVSGEVPLGRALENDLSADPGVETEVWAKATDAHLIFWDEWALWRHAIPGAPGGAFGDITWMFHLEEQLIAHMGLEPGDTVIDLGCGRALMAQFMPDTIAEYWGVDSHSLTVSAARSELKHLRLSGKIVEHDLIAGLPEQVVEAITQAKRGKVVVRWGLYLPKQVIVKIVRQAFEAGAYDFTIDQLTAGKFSPPSLLLHFIPFLVVGLVQGRFSVFQVWRALRALPKMIPYGLQLIKLFPIWSADQIAEALNGLGCEVQVLARPLWGQTTYMRVTRNSPPVQ